MAISKVTLNGTTLMDVTQDTVAANNLLTGETATGADGEPVAGGLTIPTFTTQEKSVSPTESEQVVQPDSGKDGLSKVTVGAISKTYVGSNISRRDSTSLSASGATVTVPAGYYATQASKSVATTTHPKPTVSINSTTGVVTASHVQTTGYVTGGTTTETLELTTKAAATITPSETQQEIASGQYLTGKQTIAAIPNNYVGSGITKDPTPTASGKTVTIPAGYYSEQTTKDVATVTQATPSVSVNSSGLITATVTQSAGYVSAGTKSGTKQLTTKSAATITPGTTDQTIAASTYLTGVQTIKGDANLVSENIAEGKSIFGVEGSFSGGGGGGETTASQKDVNFIDFDGTIRYSYTASEFANSTALPANPLHSGLTSQGWNWSLADAKAYVAKYGKLWIGQMYITDDGKTRVYIHLEEGRTSPMLGCCPNGTVVVDWGDGSATETLTGTSLSTVKWTSTHNYAAAGDYVITLEVTSGTMWISGDGSTNARAYMLRYSSTADERNCVYQNAIQKVEVGTNTNIGRSAFSGCYSLTSITIPNSVTNIISSAFDRCYSLASITIPNSVTSISSSAFYMCQSLLSIAIPNGVTSVGGSAFYNCHSLVSITIPNGVTSIDSGQFNGCYSLASVTIPNGVTSIDSSAFSGCHSLSSVTVPNSVTSISGSAFASCYSLASITIQNGITKINSNTFDYCYSLASVTIPNGVTSIGSSAFRYCYSLVKIRFAPTTPPTVSNSNAWSGIPTDCVISVPTGTLSAYTSATNYPDPATYTYIEE